MSALVNNAAAHDEDDPAAPGTEAAVGADNGTATATTSYIAQASAAIDGVAEANAMHVEAQQFGDHALHAAHAEDGENAAVRQPAGENAMAPMHADGAADKGGVGALGGMHDDDVGGLGDMDGDAGGCAEHLLAQDVRFLPLELLQRLHML